ncbi:MAG: hypothetical protein ACE5JJ_06115 [Nitrospinota bacterium]
MDPLDFLALAERLAKEAGEAALRSAISWAYYGVFIHIRDDLEQRGLFIGKAGGEHEEIPKRLEEAGEQQTADDLRDLRIERRRADYEMRRSFVQRDALAACQAAGHVHRAFGSIDPLNFAKAKKATPP